MDTKNIIIANDHAAVDAKFAIKEYLESLNYKVINLGTDTKTSTHYPYFALSAANALKKESNAKAIVICGSGIGISLAANKIKGIRCMLCNTPLLAQIARESFNINMLGLGARVIGTGLMELIVDAFLGTKAVGGGVNMQNIEFLDNMLKQDLSAVTDPVKFFK